MKQSIEHPSAIVSHQSFWLYECFPHGMVNNFKDRWVFLYPWNQPSLTGNPEDVGGKPYLTLPLTDSGSCHKRGRDFEIRILLREQIRNTDTSARKYL